MNEQDAAEPVGEAISAVRLLRRRWKPIKERLSTQQKDHPTAIRFHRCCSCLLRAEDADLDLKISCQWIAFNALYGQWNQARSEAEPDRESWKSFLPRLLALGNRHQVATVLQQHKRLVLAILDDSYLNRFFWKEPSPASARQTTSDRRAAGGWYQQGQWSLLLEKVMERIYLLRCQLLHGAASYNSRLNRTSLQRCTLMMGHLLDLILDLWIDSGADEDWGPMCYPPQS